MYTSIKVSAAKSKNLRDPRGLTDLSKYTKDPKIVNFARIDFIFFLNPLFFHVESEFLVYTSIKVSAVKIKICVFLKYHIV